MDSYLYHHGIKGQKWGVRRFQNKDGTLTLEGQQHRLVSSTIKKSVQQGTGKAKEISSKITTPQGAQSVQQGIKGTNQALQGAKKLSDAINDASKKPQAPRKRLSKDELDKLSNKELQDLVTRISLEQRYSDLTANKANRSKVDTGFRCVEALLSLTGGVLTVAVALNQLKG